MLNLDYIKKAFQVHLKYPTPEKLKTQLADGGSDLMVAIKPALQNPDTDGLSDQLNHQIPLSSLLDVVHPNSLSAYLPKLEEIVRGDNGSGYFISFKQLAVDDAVRYQYQWYFCFTRLKPLEKRLFLLYVSLSADEVWIRETERFVKQETYRMELMEKYNGLTDREKEIIRWVAGGHTNPQTAEALGISRRTVESHRKNINRKLGMSNLAELVRFALAFDLV